MNSRKRGSSNINAAFKPILVTFSGVDGAGKTTQIENLQRCAANLGLRVRVVAFWDNIVVGSRYRENFVHAVYKSERGIGRPDKPVERRDKNVQAWYLTVARHLLYLMDAISAVGVIRRASEDLDLLIVDRYIYDELASLRLNNAVTKRFIHVLRKVAPRPDLALVLDADPIAARARKPEYPLEFMQKCRRNYMRLVAMLHELTMVPALPLEEATCHVESLFLRTMGIRVIARQNQVAAAAEQKPAA